MCPRGSCFSAAFTASRIVRPFAGRPSRIVVLERHIAALQLETVRRCIRLWSNPGELVLDPFAGIGTTGYVAIQQGRTFVGCELKRSYFEAACRNIERASNVQNLGLFEAIA